MWFVDSIVTDDRTHYCRVSVCFLVSPHAAEHRTGGGLCTQDDCAFTHAEILGLKLLFALMDQVWVHSLPPPT